MANDKLMAMECRAEMHDRILAGIPLPDIARWLQDEKGEFPGVKRDSVVRSLHRYKNSIPPKELGLACADLTQKRLEEVSEDVNELFELQKLFRLQMRRINLAADLEAQLKFPNSKLHQDITVGKQMLLDMAELKFRLGIYAEKPREVNLNHSVTSNKAIEEMDPDERRRAAVLATDMLKLLTAPAVAVTTETPPPAPDGAVEADYEIVSSTPAVPDHAPPQA